MKQKRYKCLKNDNCEEKETNDQFQIQEKQSMMLFLLFLGHFISLVVVKRKWIGANNENSRTSWCC